MSPISNVHCFNLTQADTEKMFNINPMNLVFLLFYLTVIGIQFLCMLLHRWGTVVTLLGRTNLFFEEFSLDTWLDKVWKEVTNGKDKRPDLNEIVEDVKKSLKVSLVNSIRASRRGSNVSKNNELEFLPLFGDEDIRDIQVAGKAPKPIRPESFVDSSEEEVDEFNMLEMKSQGLSENFLYENLPGSEV